MFFFFFFCGDIFAFVPKKRVCRLCTLCFSQLSWILPRLRPRFDGPCMNAHRSGKLVGCPFVVVPRCLILFDISWQRLARLPSFDCLCNLRHALETTLWYPFISHVNILEPSKVYTSCDLPIFRSPKPAKSLACESGSSTKTTDCMWDTVWGLWRS